MNIHSSKNRAASPRRNVTGFTFVELMIVVAIIAILTAIALPSYQQHVLKSHRVDAKNALLDLAAREERYFANNNKYSNTPADLGYNGAFPMSIVSSSAGTSYYKINVTNANATGFNANATPTGSQVNDTTCYTYTIDQLGSQGNSDSGGAALTNDCW